MSAAAARRDRNGAREKEGLRTGMADPGGRGTLGRDLAPNGGSGVCGVLAAMLQWIGLAGDGGTAETKSTKTSILR